MRSFEELAAGGDAAWPRLARAIESSPVPVAVLPSPSDAGRRCLVALQVTTGSSLGAMALHVGALLVDHGWVRLYGAGHAPLPDLATRNGIADGLPSEAYLVVGADVVGGRFAVNGGGLPGEQGEVSYWGPDTLAWTPLGSGYGDFLRWVLSGATSHFYADLRWSGWQADVASLPLDRAILMYPPPCATEGSDVELVSRKPVPSDELGAWLDALAAGPDDGPVRISVTP